jgi:RhoGAP domain
VVCSSFVLLFIFLPPQEYLNKGHMICVSFVRDPHTAACLLKEFLGELVEPLLLFDLYNPWLNVGAEKIADDEKLRIAEELLSVLPPENLDLLSHIITLCHEIQQRSGTNLMSASNLSRVFGPNLLKSPEPDPNGVVCVLVR